jgi:adenylylsulfate kinase-like enzyme
VTARGGALFVSGRPGAGKSSVAYEVHAQLSAAGVRHCLIEDGNLPLP